MYRGSVSNLTKDKKLTKKQRERRLISQNNQKTFANQPGSNTICPKDEEVGVDYVQDNNAEHVSTFKIPRILLRF